MSLNSEVESYLKRVLPQAKKELKYNKNEDWSKIKSVPTRENVYKIQDLLVHRNIETALKLYKLAGEDVKNKRVKDSLAILVEFFTILDERYSSMIEEFDWTTFKLDEKDANKRVEEEVKFQSGVLDDINKYEIKLKSINFGDESDDVSVSFYGNIPAPLMMSSMIEEIYPEVKEAVNKK